MIILKQKPDILGTLVSFLCLIHCIVTPFIFIAQTSCCKNTPIWWSFIDIFFLFISFYAIYWSTKSTTIEWVKYSLWLSWSILSIIIVNEKLTLFFLPEVAIYFPAFALIILHLYNRKYCKCNVDKCCVK